MDQLIEVLKYTLPSVVVFLTAYFLFRNMSEAEKVRRQTVLMEKNQKIATPIRLKAYERLTLFLERIAPSSILPRVVQGKMSVVELQRELNTTIRMEFEHNLSQQIYVSSQCWHAVVTTKENLIKLVNMAAAGTLKQNPEATGQDFAKLLLETVMGMEQEPNAGALEIIKSEVRGIFGA